LFYAVASKFYGFLENFDNFDQFNGQQAIHAFENTAEGLFNSIHAV